MIITTAQAADIFGVTQRTIHNWIEAGCPVYERAKPNKFNSVDLLAWWNDREIDRRIVSVDGDKLDPMQEQARLNLTRRLKVEVEILIMKGELCRTVDIEQWWADAITAAKVRMLSMPTTLAHRVLSAKEYGEVESIIKKAVYEALDEVAGIGRPDSPGASGELDKGAESALI